MIIIFDVTVPSYTSFIIIINMNVCIILNCRAESQSQLISNSASDTFTSHTDEEFEDGNVQYGDDDSKLCVVKYLYIYLYMFAYIILLSPYCTLPSSNSSSV